MKKIFKSFKEQCIDEAKTLSPKNIKQYNWNKNSVKKLKSYSYKFGNLELSFDNFEYFGNISRLNDLYIGKQNSLLDYLKFKLNTNDDIFTFELTVGNKSEFNINELKDNNLNFLVSTNEMNIFRLNSDMIGGLIDLINYLFKKYKNEITKALQLKINIPILYVIPAGKISVNTGNTRHGWSIYDNPNSVLAIDSGNIILYDAKGMKVGDKFKILNDQKHKILMNEFTVNELIPCTYKDYVAFCKRTGAKIPIKSYSKQPGTFEYILWSIK